MARNKHPELTVAKILEVSRRLFFEKGYENTSVQDILDRLGGLTKGAVYHHFRSKEEILLAVTDQLFADQEQEWRAVQLRTDLNGAEKLQHMFLRSIGGNGQAEYFRAAPNLLDNPRILALMMKDIVETSAPSFIRPLIEEGVADGSIRTEYPGQMAEVILLLINIWISPLVFPEKIAEIERRCLFFDELFRDSGVRLYTEEMKAQFVKLYHLQNFDK